MSGPEELRALVEEMRAGLEGVTPGPWYQTGAPWFRSGDGVLAGSPDGNIAHIIADCDNFAAPRDEYDGPFPLGDQERDAAHIARCSPENIAKLLDAAESSLASPAGMEGWTRAVRDVFEIELKINRAEPMEAMERALTAASVEFAAPHGEAK